MHLPLRISLSIFALVGCGGERAQPRPEAQPATRGTTQAEEAEADQGSSAEQPEETAASERGTFDVALAAAVATHARGGDWGTEWLRLTQYGEGRTEGEWLAWGYGTPTSRTAMSVCVRCSEGDDAACAAEPMIGAVLERARTACPGDRHSCNDAARLTAAGCGSEADAAAALRFAQLGCPLTGRCGGSGV